MIPLILIVMLNGLLWGHIYIYLDNFFKCSYGKTCQIERNIWKNQNPKGDPDSLENFLKINFGRAILLQKTVPIFVIISFAMI